MDRPALPRILAANCYTQPAGRSAAVDHLARHIPAANCSCPLADHSAAVDHLARRNLAANCSCPPEHHPSSHSPSPESSPHSSHPSLRRPTPPHSADANDRRPQPLRSHCLMRALQPPPSHHRQNPPPTASVADHLTMPAEHLHPPERSRCHRPNQPPPAFADAVSREPHRPGSPPALQPEGQTTGQTTGPRCQLFAVCPRHSPKTTPHTTAPCPATKLSDSSTDLLNSTKATLEPPPPTKHPSPTIV